VNPLKGQARWVTLPSTWASLIGVALATVYAIFTVNIRAGTRVSFSVIMFVVVLVASVLGDREEQARLRTLKKLGAGDLIADRELLSRALIEAARIPEVSFWVNLAYWYVGALTVGILYALVPGVYWSTSSRLVFIGFAVGPLGAMLAHLMVLKNARVVMSKIADQGLSPADLVRALPAERAQLRRRLVIFTTLAVVTPMVLVCDLGLTHVLQTVEAMLNAADAATQAQLVSAAQSQGVVSLAVVASLVLLVVIACGYLGGSALGEPLRAIAEETQRVSRGQLGRTRIIPSEDELWSVAVAFSSMEQQLMVALTQLKEAGLKISATTTELVSSSTRHEGGANEQTGALAQTSATTEELARSARQIAQNASDVSRLAQAMLDAANTGKRSAGAFYSAILRVREGNQAIADSVVKLNKRVQQVGRIVEFIDGIADKSDLLALNAELEGNKAGDVGRGFSLVAAEMRRLSESVMGSTREINRLISEIRDATNAAVMATEAGVKATDAGSGLARQVTESLDRIVAFANQTSDAVKSITLATHQQQAGTDQLASAMSDILRSTESALSATQQMTSANTDLNNLSNELQSTVARFEVQS
jgi:methyl-accepting chemotaxis protein